MNTYCPATGKACEKSAPCQDGCSKCKPYELRGWSCRRCGRMHAPFVRVCDCLPRSTPGNGYVIGR